MATEKTLRDLSQALAAHIEPRLYPEISAIDVAGKTGLRIQAKGQLKPYFAYGRAYIRVADENRRMSARELESQFLNRNSAALRWDNEPSTTALAELSEAKIRSFVERAGLPWSPEPHNATHATNATKITQALTKLDLLQGGQLVNAARLFFAHQPIQLRCAVFAGTTSATILDRHDFDGDVLELIEEAEKYILKNIHFGTRLEGLRWVEVPEISRPALREAVINAFFHRDWRDPDYIQIAIYKNRVEIRNPGGLIDGLTIEAMRRGKDAHRRNPLMAELFRRIGMVEARGRGMPLILENAPDVAFREIANLFIASFERPSATAVTNPEISSPTKETAAENDSGRPLRMNDRLLVLIRRQPGVTAAELAGATGIGVDGVNYHLNQLKQAGDLRRLGPTQGGRWEVTEPDTKGKT
jgi:ATP-dependent DNA helicase RecG